MAQQDVQPHNVLLRTADIMQINQLFVTGKTVPYGC
jgi:hypothetical protein